MLEGKEVFLLGGGTSLNYFDLNKLKKHFVIAINHSIEFYDAPYLIFGDKIFLHKTKFDLKKYKGIIFASDRCANSEPLQSMRDNKNIYYFECRRDEPVLNPKKGLYHPTSSGVLAINLALQMRAKTIYLLGYDYYFKSGSMHFYPDYEHHKKYDEERLKLKLKKFDKFDQWKNKIINCNPDSLVENFRKVKLSDIL